MTPQDQEHLFRLMSQLIKDKVESAPAAAAAERAPEPEPAREVELEAPRVFAARRASSQPDFVGVDVAVAERAVAAYKKTQASRLIKVGALPLIAVCIVICAVLAYRDFDSFLLLFSASGRVIVGATIGLLIDLFAMPNHQPENLEGIEQGWAWNRRLWLMAASAVCLGMQP